MGKHAHRRMPKMPLSFFQRKEFTDPNDADHSATDLTTQTEAVRNTVERVIENVLDKMEPKREEAKKPEPKKSAPLQGVKFWQQRKQLDHDRIISVAPTLK